MELTYEQFADKRVYVCIGEKEGGDMVPHAWAVYEKFKTKGLDPDHIKLDIIEGEGHWHLTWRNSLAKSYPWWAEFSM